MWLRQQKSGAEAGRQQVCVMPLLWYAEEHGEGELMNAESAFEMPWVPGDLASNKLAWRTQQSFCRCHLHADTVS